MTAKLLGNGSRGKAFVLSAPAGTGKTTVVDMLQREFPNVRESISCTTRPPRQGEIPGQHYHFISDADFQSRIARGEFLEYVQLYGYYYGTSKLWVEEQLSKGIHVMLTIDTQGAQLLRGQFPAVFIFMAPPSMEELHRRLSARQTEDEKVIRQRLEWAQRELQAINDYDYLVVNEDLEVAYQVVRSIVIAEDHHLEKE